MSEDLRHEGTKEHSGRYPWGSGGDPYQRNMGFRGHVKDLQKRGFTKVQIAELEGIKTQQLRTRLSLVKNEINAVDRAQAVRLRDLGNSPTAIGREMNRNESSVRGLLDPVMAERAAIARATMIMLKENVDQKRFIDIGLGVSNNLGVSATRVNNAVAALVEQGYKVHTLNVEQSTPGQFTRYKVLGTPDSMWSEIKRDPGKIGSLTVSSEDYGRTYRSPLGLKPIQNVDAKRIKVIYGSEGGNLKDGVIELRPGVSDLDLGGSKYAQVRIGVNGTHYLKGMAIYNDNLPDGVDIAFNTIKENTGNKLKAFKPMEQDKAGNIDLDNPFGATIKREGQRGALNVVNEEGDWVKWSKTLSSQILSKQTPQVAKKQLALTLTQKKQEYDEIMALTNPVVQKRLLEDFADDCDSASVHLKAAALPRQANKIILPVPGLKETEVYAPGFNNSETVVLIRHPHGGKFEIPQLTVNNKSKEAQAILGNNPKDAIGIHPNVAKKLSGADFDGDTVIIVPNPHGLIKTAASVKSLKDFDPRTAYEPYEGMPARILINGKWPGKPQQMGTISNLITDMTIKGANIDDIAKAVKHSMVIIDVEKHNLNYKQSYKDNSIAALSATYQNSSHGGASTLISKAGSEARVTYRKAGKTIVNPTTGKKKIIYFDPKTGEKLYTDTPESFINKKGKLVERQTKTTKMENTPDAFTLSSGRPIEEVYASHANELKALGNKARVKTLSIIPTPYNASAKKVYEQEVNTLNAQLNIALKNKPMERNAQAQTKSVVDRIKKDNPNMDPDDLKKVRNSALIEARIRSHAKSDNIKITDREWAAIQAGALHPSKLTQIIQNADIKIVKQLATPRTYKELTTAQLNKAQTMLNNEQTIAEVSEALGVSVSTLSKALP